MKVKYEIEDYRPDCEWISIKWTSPDEPDLIWYTQFEFPDFSKEKLIDHIRAVASRVAGSWTRAAEHPNELSIPMSGTVDVEPELYLPYEPNPQPEPEPEYDPWTQRAELVDVSADQTAKSVPWVVTDIPEDEQKAMVEGAAYQLKEEILHLRSLTDWIFLPDAPEVEDMDAWLEFRKALADMPNQPDFPKNPVWPERPDLAE
jgi:hypothetical protein